VDRDDALGRGEVGDYLGVPVTGGRPFIPDLIAELEGKPRPHVFVCGPPGIASMSDLACLKHGVSFHKEVFAF